MRHTYLTRLSLVRATGVLIASASAVFSSSSFAQYQGTAYVPNGTVIGVTNTPGDITYPYSSGSGATATVSFTANPIASVSFAANASNPLGQAILSGGGIMTYRFQVQAQPFAHVPVDFSGLYSSST